jgi:hypothetical protein
LRQLIAAHSPGRHINLLSVDCEGLDLQVLKSADIGVFRPTILVVEDFRRYLELRN